MRRAGLALALPVFALLALACSRAPQPRERGLSAILITLDTTRADALGCFGGRPGITPNLDALAKESVAYDWARTVTPATLPAHATLLTGLYPHRHTVRDNGLNALPSGATTLAELLGEHGFATAAFVSASVLDRAFGLDQGFASYSQPARNKVVVTSATYATRNGKETAAQACHWLESLGNEQRFFAWVHFFDAHRPYHVRPELVERAGGSAYLASVSLVDEAVGRVLTTLRERGRLDDTVVIVVADHGEGLGEHGEETHAAFVYDSTLRVPLLVRHPHASRAGERSDELVSAIDVMPTLCEALGVAPPPDIDGTSLWRARVAEDRGVYFESYYGFLRYAMSPIAGWVDRRGKFIQSPSPELYEPRTDPRELANVVERRAGDLASYRQQIASVLARAPVAASSNAALDASTRDGLRQLGYVDAGGAKGPLPSALEPSQWPSPHACAAEIADLEEAARLGSSGEIEHALELVRGVLARRPDQPFALEYLGYFLLASRRPDDAAAALERALAVGADRGSVHRQLAACRLAQGRAADAETHLRRAVELDAGDVEALRTLRELLVKRGADAEAEQVLAQLQRALAD